MVTQPAALVLTTPFLTVAIFVLEELQLTLLSESSRMDLPAAIVSPEEEMPGA